MGSPLVIAGSNPFASSSFSSSVPSRYTFRNPSKVITSPFATKSSLLPLLSIVTVVFSNRASAIWEAIERFQISEYSFSSSGLPSCWLTEKSVGRIASCASCAPLDLFVNVRLSQYSLPYDALIAEAAPSSAESLKVTESVRIYVIRPAS